VAGLAGRGVGRLVFGSVLVPLLLVVGILGIFGIGTGRPVGVVLVIAAFALLRRLVFMILGGAGRAAAGAAARAAAASNLITRLVAPPGDKITVRDLSWRGPNSEETGSAMRCVTTLPFLVAAASRPRPRGGPHRAAHRGRGARRLRRRT